MSRALLALLLAAGWPAFAADYRLQPGDVLELVVVAPPMREEVPVDIDGNITLPLAGPIAAAGRRLAEVAADARDRLASATLPPMSEGELLPARIWPAAVSLSLRQYRPIYVGGAVRAGGAFPFAPGLTARRALVLAGGAGDLPDGQLRRLEIEGTLARLTVKRDAAAPRLARLRLERDPAAPAAPLPETERAILAERRGQDAAAGTHYDTAIRHTRAQIDDLTSQLANETEGVAADRDDFARIEDLRNAGTATELRLTDARRALLFSTTRQLQTATELARTTRELGSVQYEKLRRILDRRLEAVADAATTTQILAELDAQITAAEHQLVWLAADTPLTISITASDGTTVTLAPDQDRLLHPGDLVNVTLASTTPTD